MHTNPTILVIGDSGKTGRRVAELLERDGIPHRSGTQKASVPFDWYDEATWPGALEGMKSAYIVFYPDLAVPGAVDIMKRFVAETKHAGLEHLVLLSGRGEHEAEASEQLVMNSGIDWTVVRCSWFMQNFSENFFVDDIHRGEIVVPVGSDTVEPFVDADDIAAVAHQALVNPAQHRNKLYELTGPELLSFAQVAERIGRAIGRDVAYIRVTPDEYKAAMQGAGLPSGTIDLIDYLFREVLDGRNSHLTDGVREALGREPKSFDEYIQKTLPTGVWKS